MLEDDRKVNRENMEAGVNAFIPVSVKDSVFVTDTTNFDIDTKKINMKSE